MKNNKYLVIHEQLIKECRQGNRKSQFELYKLYYKAMYNTSYRIVNNPLDAEDAMQEAFLKAFKNLDKYNGEVSFGSWLKRIVINQSIDCLRKRKVEFINIEDIQDSLAEDEAEISMEIENNTSVKKIINEINNLPDGYKLILSLYVLEGYDHNEIAEILHISPSTSRSQFNRAKKRMLENINKRKNEKA